MSPSSKSGCYFLLQDDRSPPAAGSCPAPVAEPAAQPHRPDGAGRPSCSGAGPVRWACCPIGARPVRPRAHADPFAGRLVLACFNQHLEFEECAGAMAGLLAEQGIALEVRTLDYGRWVSGRTGRGSLARHPQPGARARLRPYAWLQGTPCCAGYGGRQTLWRGLTQWRASGVEPGPRALLAEVQRQGWFVPCSTTGWSWRAGSACTACG